MLELKSAVSPETALTEASEVSGKTAEKIRFSSDFRLTFRKRHNQQKVAFFFRSGLAFSESGLSEFLSLYFKEPLAFSASHAEVRRPVARPPPAGRSGVRPAVLPRLVPRQVVEEVLAEVFELRPDCLEVEEEHPHVVGGALLAVLARLLRARALRGLGLGGNHQGKNRGCFDLARMITAIEGAVMGTSP